MARRLVYAPGMPATYHFTRHAEQSRHNYSFATDKSTGRLVMATPNGTGHEGARLYGGGEGPDNWLKVRPLDSPRDHWEMRNSNEDGGCTLAAAANGWVRDALAYRVPCSRPRKGVRDHLGTWRFDTIL